MIRQHARILVAFLAGLVCAVSLAVALQDGQSLAVPLMAYAAGQGLAFLLLAGLIVRGLEHGAAGDLDVWRSVTRYPILLGIGLFYSLGVWGDKIVFWVAEGVSVGPMPSRIG